MRKTVGPPDDPPREEEPSGKYPQWDGTEKGDPSFFREALDRAAKVFEASREGKLLDLIGNDKERGGGGAQPMVQLRSGTRSRWGRGKLG